MVLLVSKYSLIITFYLQVKSEVERCDEKFFTAIIRCRSDSFQVFVYA